MHSRSLYKKKKRNLHPKETWSSFVGETSSVMCFFFFFCFQDFSAGWDKMQQYFFFFFFLSIVHHCSGSQKQTKLFWERESFGQTAKNLAKHTTTNTVSRCCFSDWRTEWSPLTLNVQEERGKTKKALLWWRRREWKSGRVRANLN